ncbi:MAG: hypothetical protein ACLQIQ_15785 [Beijerinckiaceae bacterium]
MDETGAPDPTSWQFLYRSDAGRIGAGTWWRGALLLAAVLAALTLGLLYVLPYAKHDLGKTPLLSGSAFGANVYVLFYAFALIFVGVCYYNLSAKRWRDMGRPPALAGLLPFVGLLAGALHWLEARVGATLPHAMPIIADIVLVLTLVWTIIDLGGLIPKPHHRD